MARLYLGNLEPGTSDDEVREFLQKYGFPAFDSIEHEPGVGTRPGVVLTFDGVDPMVLGSLQQRIHNMYWKNRKLNALILKDDFA
ncbi:hypothetical protein BGLT_07065 [Caballeronia glathei]|jgi:RNA recognition motif-containing protein|uniref:RNA-binding protein n=1 Tax=Caballeronia glathei TaxID=60547 RepID=A0A069Q4B9_9BURK|nr:MULTISPECIES: hypothetical protein [Burkholderiaceae]KDR44606.1 hypothetical protein BG61_00075 [Caballeronia glathei]TCK42691.1 hypothetical protein B0G84_0985 [Paraburkholderia sp. BL8N3]CEJ96085.1 hypothetical protein BGLT_07065 [Caballeronia glathei]